MYPSFHPSHPPHPQDRQNYLSFIARSPPRPPSLPSPLSIKTPHRLHTQNVRKGVRVRACEFPAVSFVHSDIFFIFFISLLILEVCTYHRKQITSHEFDAHLPQEQQRQNHQRSVPFRSASFQSNFRKHKLLKSAWCYVHTRACVCGIIRYAILCSDRLLKSTVWINGFVCYSNFQHVFHPNAIRMSKDFRFVAYR